MVFTRFLCERGAFSWTWAFLDELFLGWRSEVGVHSDTIWAVVPSDCTPRSRRSTWQVNVRMSHRLHVDLSWFTHINPHFSSFFIYFYFLSIWSDFISYFIPFLRAPVSSYASSRSAQHGNSYCYVNVGWVLNALDRLHCLERAECVCACVCRRVG